MLHVIAGTKAQYLKMAPVIRELESRGTPYTLVDTGQHAAQTASIRALFGLREPDLLLSGNRDDIGHLGTLLLWNARVIAAGLFRGRFFVKAGDTCLVHGDTVSTFQGALLAKWCGARLAHVEAGERTHAIFRPFPEEAIRRLTDRMSDILFASSDSAYANLRRENLRGRSVNIRHNTIFDTVRLAEGLEGGEDLPGDYVLMSIHRAETVYSRRRMEFVVSTALKAAGRWPVVWGLHDVTRNGLKRFGLLGKLRGSGNISLRGLFRYPSFIRAMKGARFLITDGGGPQEESFLLNVPCLLMRTETERDFHPNVLMSRFNESRVAAFMDSYGSYRSEEPYRFESPSRMVVDHLAAPATGSGGSGG